MDCYSPVENRKRKRVSWDDDSNGLPPPLLLTDMSGMTFVVSKYNTQQATHPTTFCDLEGG